MHHGGLPIPTPAEDLDQRVRQELGKVKASHPDISELLSGIVQRQVNIEQQIEALTRAQPHLRVAIDVLFPPFTTVIDDPVYPQGRTVIGQWYD